MFNLVLFGPPCAGKGTQAKKIAEKYQLTHLSTGEMIRREIAQGTEVGKMAGQIINNGQLLPDELVVGLLRKEIAGRIGKEGFLFDGFPRTVEQAKKLDGMLAEYGSALHGFINIRVPEPELKERMRKRAGIEGRADDTEEAIDTRFREYHRRTTPVAEYYRPLCRDIRGDRSVDEVFTDISRFIDDLEAD
ncbi:MAG: adenylate kinase [Culturomica sp.]|nr:adenylate kinase [Culturomica sp.]